MQGDIAHAILFAKRDARKRARGGGGGEFEERQERRDSIIKKNKGNQIFRDVRIQ